MHQLLLYDKYKTTMEISLQKLRKLQQKIKIVPIFYYENYILEHLVIFQASHTSNTAFEDQKQNKMLQSR